MNTNFPKPDDAVLGTGQQQLRLDAAVLGFAPSRYQQAIFDWVEKGRGNAVVEAVAGAGKTTTLIKASQRIRNKTILFCAFNKHIAETLANEVGSRTDCRTIHSLGLRCLYNYLRVTYKDIKLDDNKYYKIASEYAPSIHFDLECDYHAERARWMKNPENVDEPEDIPTLDQVSHNLEKIATFFRITLTDIYDMYAVREMIEHYNLQPVASIERILPSIKSILELGEQIAAYQKVIDFTDMIWLPNRWNLSPRFLYDFILVDEAQDLNKAQLEIVLKHRSRNSRLLFCGDRYQSIYGFAGADTSSIQNIIERTDAVILPLSICYRCPQSHIRLVQKFVEHIEPALTAPEGEVHQIKLEIIEQHLKEGDVVISRRTAPVVKLCINLIRSRIPARVIGREIGKSLNAIIKKVARMHGFSYDLLINFLRKYAAKEIQKLEEQGQDNQARIEFFWDKVFCIRVCYQSFNCTNVEQLCEEIDNLFDDERPKVTLSTIHKAKGIEANRVFILKPQDLPMRWRNQQPWELQQELNIKVVALTRAKKSLFIVEDDDSKKQRDEDKIIIDNS